MGAIGGMLGLSGGAGGSGFAGPTSANMQNAVDTGQTTQAYQQNQQALGSQNALLSALQGQNGLGNQTQNYNQLQGVINGTGPNPAQAQLAQATGQNVANQAALMAGQRGASSNVGLMARQAAQQGANTQQQAVGQAATMQANQSLNALGQAGQMANTQAGQQVAQTNANVGAQQAEQGQLLSALQGQNANQVAMQSNINNVNAGLANTQMQGGQALIGGLMNGVGAAMAAGGVVPNYDDGGSVMSQAPTQQPAAQAGPKSGFAKFVNGVKAGTAPAASSGAPQTSSGALNSGMSSLTQGIARQLQGSPSTPQTDANFTMPQMGSQFSGQAPNLGVAGVSQAPSSPGLGVGSDMGVSNPIPSSGIPSIGSDEPEKYGPAFASGGKVPALLSPGEKYLPPSAVEKVKKGADPIKVGKQVPGKPKYPGNDYRNDTFSTELEAGGIVIPNKVLQSKNPHQQSYDFINRVIAKRKARS
jgi:hypothetical protein